MAKILQSLVALLITVFLITSAGCMSGNLPDGIVGLDDNSVELTASDVNNVFGTDSIDNSISTIGQLINKNDYLDGIKKFDAELYKDPRVIETFKKKEPCINQLFLDDGHKSYIIAWNNFGFTSAMVIFIKEKSRFIPIYFIEPGRDITGVEQMDLGLDQKFIEITSYFGTGSHMGQITNILAIKDKLVTNAWNYETISYEGAAPNHPSAKSYASFTILPVLFETPRINLQQIDIMGKDKNETEIIFLWDEQQSKFVKE